MRSSNLVQRSAKEQYKVVTSRGGKYNFTRKDEENKEQDRSQSIRNPGFGPSGLEPLEKQPLSFHVFVYPHCLSKDFVSDPASFTDHS